MILVLEMGLSWMFVVVFLFEYVSFKLLVWFWGVIELVFIYLLVDNIDRICIFVCVMYEGLWKVVVDYICVFLLGIFY